MDAKAGFDAALLRANHMLRLYDLLCDTRLRSARTGWKEEFRDSVGWQGTEEVVRIDGKDHRSILVLQKSLGIDREHFTSDYLSELLRFALVAAVSALDRYVHDVVVDRCWSLLSRPQDGGPRALREFKLSVVSTKRALEKQRREPHSRPGTIIKAAIQEELHRRTFQSPTELDGAAQLLGIKSLWNKLSAAMAGKPTSKDVQSRLNGIARRRNQIVHEADLIRRTRGQTFKAREISADEARTDVAWICKFVDALEVVVQAE